MSATLAPNFFDLPLAEVDPEIAAVLAGELEREQRTLEMIASENFAPRAVLEASTELGDVIRVTLGDDFEARRDELRARCSAIAERHPLYPWATR
ncbi:hypothetical protein [Conexibacter sp. CPCC 206217]|uniref:hypothetical protein n=1 Tax=Conexibacter sp. CPCC 206217 TaxID=3064574 RepID=UPI0027266DCA|nr:hypothetical protein [Conexibacter sp. CPCC 206217]MDO8210213.1 hypothetical protein [Conexibacter sp. CPCC 206217]